MKQEEEEEERSVNNRFVSSFFICQFCLRFGFFFHSFVATKMMIDIDKNAKFARQQCKSIVCVFPALL